MSNTTEFEKLAKVKLAMAEKYETLARVAHSKVKRRSFSNSAMRYRQQAAVLQAR